jgi:hypothetical protein
MQYAATIKTVRNCGNQFFRIVLAHHNRARFDVFYQEYTQSFAPMYIMAESSDYVDVPDDDTVMEQISNMLWLRGIEVEEITWY